MYHPADCSFKCSSHAQGAGRRGADAISLILRIHFIEIERRYRNTCIYELTTHARRDDNKANNETYSEGGQR